LHHVLIKQHHVLV